VSTAHAYPTRARARGTSIAEFFASRDETDAVLLVNSCARGKATADSCLDMQVIVRPEVVAHYPTEAGAQTQADLRRELDRRPRQNDPLARAQLSP
jgi:hypothetical protein